MKDYIGFIENENATLPTDKLMVLEHAKRIASIYKCARPLAQFVAYILLNGNEQYDMAEWTDNKSFIIQYMDETFHSIPDFCTYYNPTYTTLGLTDGIENILEMNRGIERCDIHLHGFTPFWSTYPNYPSLKTATKIIYHMNMLATSNYIFTHQIKLCEIRRLVEIYRKSIRKADRMFKKDDENVIGCQNSFSSDKIIVGTRFSDTSILMAHDETTAIMFDNMGFFCGNVNNADDFKYDMEHISAKEIDALKFCRECMATCNNMTMVLDNFEGLLERLRNEYIEYTNKQQRIK